MAKSYPAYRDLTVEQRRQVDILMMQDESAGRERLHVNEYIPMVIDRVGMKHGGKACRGRQASKSAETS